MRFARRILLVAALTAALVAGGIAWERLWLSPLIEQARPGPAPAESAMDDLPTECLEELSPMEPFSTAADPPLAGANEVHGERSPDGGGNVLRNEGSKQIVMQVQVADSAPALTPTECNAAARPIQQAQSVEWNQLQGWPAAALGGGLQGPARASSSAEEALRHDDRGNALTLIDVLGLIRRLRADDEEQRAEARRELPRRGFSEVDLELARQLFSPDVEVRKQLARAVPRLSSVDAVQWLLWLASDPQPDVRLAAVSTLATTGDPALLERVEALARNDHDPQIHALAQQIARQRDLASRRGDPAEPAGAANQFR